MGAVCQCHSLGIPVLQHASAEERKDWQLLGDGYAIEWPALNEYIGIADLLASKQSGES